MIDANMMQLISSAPKETPYVLSIYCPLTHFNHQIINILLIFFVRCVPISKLCTTIKETLHWKYYHTSNRVFHINDQIIWKPCNRKRTIARNISRTYWYQMLYILWLWTLCNSAEMNTIQLPRDLNCVPMLGMAMLCMFNCPKVFDLHFISTDYVSNLGSILFNLMSP